MHTTRDLRGFTGAGYDVGRSKPVQALWMLIQGTVFMRWWFPSRLRNSILRAFGAQIGDGVFVRHRARIHWPWKLTIGDGAWVGEGAWLLNLEHIHLGPNSCISQDALLCTGSHDRRSPTFEFANAPIVIQEGAWVAARAVVLPGVTVGSGATVAANCTVARDVSPNSLHRGQ